MRDRLPEPVERVVGVGIGVDDPGPVHGRGGRHAPVCGAAVDERTRAGQVGKEIEPRAVGRHAVEGVGGRRPAQRDPGGVLVGEVLHPVGHPGRDVRERPGVAVQQPLALDPLVGVPDVDELGPALVGGSRDLAGQRLLADVARDAEQLAGLNVRPELHDQVGEPAGQV